MRSERGQALRRLVEYDGFRHRLWILGQRCHHGATGCAVTGLACVGLIADRHAGRSFAALAAAGSALMVHDWKDHSFWFERGYGTQP